MSKDIDALKRLLGKKEAFNGEDTFVLPKKKEPSEFVKEIREWKEDWNEMSLKHKFGIICFTVPLLVGTVLLIYILIHFVGMLYGDFGWKGVTAVILIVMLAIGAGLLDLNDPL